MRKYLVNSITRISSFVLATAIVLSSSYQISLAEGDVTSTSNYTYVSPEKQKLNSNTNKSIRVDINKVSSNINDYGTTFWNNWFVSKSTKQTATYQGVTFTLADSKGASIEPGNNKKLVVSSAYNPRKTMDGVKSATGNSILLTLSGLSAGTHSITTIHSSWDENLATSSIGTKMSISIDSTATLGVSSTPGASSTIGVSSAIGVSSTNSNSNVMSSIPCPNFINNDENAGIGYITFNVEDGKDITIAIKSEDLDKSAELSAFIIDGSDPAKTISKIQPADGEMHYDEALGLNWQAGAGAASHDVYLGTDYDTVNVATTSSNSFKGNQTTATYALKDLSYAAPIYWWRVDEHTATGEIIKGETFAFRPRRISFPTAEGYGRFATGGRGGRVVEVTNLNDSGDGSLRQALEVEKGPRTVVFKVGGVIPLKSKLTIPGDGGDVYVAGQTAPGDGITLTQFAFGAFGSKDIIIRDIRLRVGDYAGYAMDGLGLGSCFDSIIDHCSISWTTDEVISSRGSRSVTYQKNIIAEPLNNSNHYNDQTKPHSGTMRHAYGGTVSGNIGSFHHNLMTNATCRTLSMGGSVESDGKHYAGYADVTNNVVYNFQYRMADGGVRRVNFVNNYYKMGPESVRNLPSDPNDPVYSSENDPGDRGYGSVSGGVLSSLWFTWEQTGHKIGFFQIDGNELSKIGYYDMQMAYLNGNKEVDIKGNTIMGTSMEENWANVGKPKGNNNYTGKPMSLADVRSDTPFFPSYVATQTADEAYTKVLSDVGANKPKLDKYDIRYINEVRTGTYTYTGSKDHLKGYIDTQNDAGGYPVYQEVQGPADSDHDGMPDEWENSHKLNPNDASDSNNISHATGGYTNLEYYLNFLAGDYDNDNTSDDSDDTNSPTISVSKTSSNINNSELIGVTASEYAFAKPVELVVKEDAATKQVVQDAIKASGLKLPNDAAIFPLDINVFVKGTDIKAQPMQGETVQLTIPIPSELLANKDKIVVVRVIDGKLEVLATKIIEKNGVYYVEFSANHFSPYALVVDNNNSLTSATITANNSKSNPSTGVSTVEPLVLMATKQYYKLIM